MDIHVFSFNLTNGIEEPGLPGLFVSPTPRHPARGRENEQLVMLLSLDGEITLPAETQQEMLSKLAGAYFKTAGTVTHALKAIVEQMNERLMARNVRQQREDGPVLGSFSAAVMHGSTLFIAQAGPNHSFVLKNETVEEYQEDSAARLLGATKAVNVRYYRCEVQPGEMTLMCSYAPASWNFRSLAASPQLNLDQMRRRLLIQMGRDLRFILLWFKQGKGDVQVYSLRPMEGLPPVLAQQPVSEPVLPTQSAQIELARSESPLTSSPVEPSGRSQQGIFLSGDSLEGQDNLRSLAAQGPAEVVRPPSSPQTTRLEQPATPAVKGPALEEPPDFPPHLDTQDNGLTGDAGLFAAQPTGIGFGDQPAATGVEHDVRMRRVERRAKKVVSGALQGGRSLRGKWTSFIRRFLPRILPGQSDKLPALSPAVLIFIAIAVPLIIVAAATTVYIQNGRSEQHLTYLAQAQVMLDQATAQDDLTLRRVNMEAALEWIAKAETYGVSQESTTMKKQIQSALDAIDGIRRMDLQLALPGGFDNTVKITRIVANQAEDLFMLDGANGRVFRLVYTRPGYEVDTQFTCGPGMVGGLIIGPLVDIAAAPIGNSFDAAVIGLDATGNMLYCSTNPANTLAITLPPPDAGWVKITAISVDSSAMHVLDSGANAVWRYEGFNIDYPNPPRLYFDNEVPDLSSGIDLLQNRDELFVLFRDGHMLQCTYSNVSTTPTRCKNPYPYQIALTGQTPQEVTSLNGQFERLQLTLPPEPSIYILDSSGPAVYQFSLALNFVSKLMPTVSGERLPPYPPSAFVVTLGRNIVVAFGNQVYIAPLPAP